MAFDKYVCIQHFIVMKISFQMKIQNPGPSGYTPLYLACQQGHMYEMFDILIIWLWHWFVTKAKWFWIKLHPKSAPTTQIHVTPVSEKLSFHFFSKGCDDPSQKALWVTFLFSYFLTISEAKFFHITARNSKFSFLSPSPIAKALLVAGANPNTFLHSSGLTPLHSACFRVEFHSWTILESLERKYKFTGKQPIGEALAGTWSKSWSCCLVSC